MAFPTNIFLGDRSCVFSMDDRSMRCVAKDLGFSAQNRHEIGRILQEDGQLHLFILHIFINLLKYYVRSV